MLMPGMMEGSGITLPITAAAAPWPGPANGKWDTGMNAMLWPLPNKDDMLRLPGRTKGNTGALMAKYQHVWETESIIGEYHEMVEG
jgi:hypothetical protein